MIASIVRTARAGARRLTNSISRQKSFFRCTECEYTVEVYDAPQSFSVKCRRCDEYLRNIGDTSKIELDKYDEGLSLWVSFGCPDCLCEEVDIDCSDKDQVCCQCLSPDCGNNEVFFYEDTS